MITGLIVNETLYSILKDHNIFEDVLLINSNKNKNYKTKRNKNETRSTKRIKKRR